MKIILLKDVDNVGEKHSTVIVKNGYGRNYLIPQGMAIVANDSNTRRVQDLVRQDERRENKMLDTFKEVAAKLEGKKLTLTAKAGASGKLFGSITTAHIANALRDQAGVEVERKKIALEDIKELGSYQVVLNLHKQLSTKVDVEVAAAE